MARQISAATQALLEAQTLVTRDFMRITGRTRDTGAPVSDAFWSGVGAISAQVVDPDTGLIVSHDFQGVGALIAIDPIAQVSNLTVQEIEVTFSQLDDRVNELLRLYSIKQAKVEIWRGEFNPDTGRMVEAAGLRFVGFVDGAPVETPAEGGEGSVKVKCKSTAQELTRGNPDLRSHESQQDRAAGDDFFKDVTAVGDLVIFWGRPGRILTDDKTSS